MMKISIETMDERPPKRMKISTSRTMSEEVSSVLWEIIRMSDQEEDLVYRMHRLVGNRWDLIAGRIPGRREEEIERFWDRLSPITHALN